MRRVWKLLYSPKTLGSRVVSREYQRGSVEGFACVVLRGGIKEFVEQLRDGVKLFKRGMEILRKLFASQTNQVGYANYEKREWQDEDRLLWTSVVVTKLVSS